jgi:hypothetical protein
MQRIRIRGNLVTALDEWNSMHDLKVGLAEMASRAVRRPGETFYVDIQVGQYNPVPGTVSVSYGYRHPSISAAPPTLPALVGKYHSMETLFELPVSLAPARGDPDQTSVCDVRS